MSTISYHRAGPEEAPDLTRLRIEFLTGLLGPQALEDVEALRKQLERYFSKALAGNTYICYIAKSGDTMAGLGGIILREQPGTFKNPSGRTGYLVNMYTVPAFRKQGICKALLNRLMDEAKALGITTFELHATKEGEPVYVQSGFELHHEPTYRKYNC